MADWQALSIQIPGQDLLEGARGALEGLMVYLEITKAILETVKVFMVDFGNPIKPLVEALLQLIVDLFESLKRSGLYAWFDVPNPLVDPNFNRFVGGFRAFVERFKSGLVDPRDANRPQPVAGAHKSGFTLIVADAESSMALMRYMEVLQRFFGKEFATPQYLPPSNFKVLPVGADGDPILAVSRVFQFQPTSIAIEWSLPPVTSPGDPGFADLIQGTSQLAFMPAFLIEKSAEVNPAVGEITVEQLSDPDAAGPVVMTENTLTLVQGSQRMVPRAVRLTEPNGDPFIKFQQYIAVDPSASTGSFLLGQLGTFRYIDTDVRLNYTYYYRVRAFTGRLAMSGTSVNFGLPQTNVVDKTLYIEWPAADSGNKPVMGKASPIARVTIPMYPERFDVIETLRRLFQTAFSLNFHLPMPEGARFDSDGLAIEPTVNSDIGKGTLTSLAGPAASFQAVPILAGITRLTDVTARFQRDPATGKLPEQPWNDTRVVRNSARLANIVAGAMLGANSAVAFKGLMENGFPRQAPAIEGLDVTNLYELVYEITKVQDPESAGDRAVQDAGVLYSDVFADPHVRLNVLAAVSFCKAFTLEGGSADWIQISLLRDVVPWSGQLIYELLAKMQALVDAYAGVMAELRAFVDLIVAKIDTLERLLQYLTSILDFVAGLSLGFYILNVPETEGGVSEWMSLIDNAGGTPPPSGPGGYTGGVALAYVAADVTPYATALRLIF